MFTVTNGVIMHQGAPLRRIGVNCPDLLLSWIFGAISGANPVVYTPRDRVTRTLQDIHDLGLGVARFLVLGFRTKTYRVGFVENQAAFLDAMDFVVSEAERIGVLLIPSLFFSGPCLPPYVGEDLRQYGTPGSATRTQMNNVISVIVPRYQNSPAIAAWEFSNETDARTSIPISTPGYSSDVAMEQPLAWTAADGWDLPTANSATAYFQTRVKLLDPVRMTASGHGGWRSSLDARNDIVRFMNIRDFDDQTDTITMHPYQTVGFSGISPGNYTGMSSFIKTMCSHSKARGKPFIVGEFGHASNSTYNSLTRGPLMKYICDNVLDSGVQLAMAWAYPANINAPTTNDFYMNLQDGICLDMLAELSAAALSLA